MLQFLHLRLIRSVSFSCSSLSFSSMVFTIVCANTAVCGGSQFYTRLSPMRPFQCAVRHAVKVIRRCTHERTIDKSCTYTCIHTYKYISQIFIQHNLWLLARFTCSPILLMLEMLIIIMIIIIGERSKRDTLRSFRSRIAIFINIYVVRMSFFPFDPCDFCKDGGV